MPLTAAPVQGFKPVLLWGMGSKAPRTVRDPVRQRRSIGLEGRRGPPGSGPWAQAAGSKDQLRTEVTRQVETMGQLSGGGQNRMGERKANWKGPRSRIRLFRRKTTLSWLWSCPPHHHAKEIKCWINPANWYSLREGGGVSKLPYNPTPPSISNPPTSRKG